MTSERVTKRGRRTKSDFYHARWNKVGLNHDRAAEVLGVSVDQVKEWDQVGNALATKYLLLWDSKNVNLPGWDGFTFSRGVLKYKGRTQWTPELLQHQNKVLNSGNGHGGYIDLKTEFRELRK